MAIDIKKIRKKTMLSQSKFGKKIGVSKQAISNYENGREPSESITMLVRRVYRGFI